MLKNLLKCEYGPNVINRFSTIFHNYGATEKILNHFVNKGYDDKQIFKLCHTYYWKNLKQDPNRTVAAEYRAKAKSNILKKLLNGIKYNKKGYLDIGCEECILPLSFGEVLGIKNINCVNIKDWESTYNIDKSEMTKCQFKYYNGVDLPYENNTMSVISATMVLHHIDPKNRDKLLSSVNKSLINGGLLIIREHDSVNKLFDDYVDFEHRFYDAILLKKFHWLDKYTTYYQSAKDWQSEIERKGFKMVRHKFFDKKADRPFMEIYVKQ